MAFRALGLLFAVDEGFELVLAFLADVLEDRHGQLLLLLESIYGEFANSGFPYPRFCGRFWRNRYWQGARDGSGPVDGARALPGPALAGRRPCADHRQLSVAAQDSSAGRGRTAGRGCARDQDSLLVLLAGYGQSCGDGAGWQERSNPAADFDRSPRPRRVVGFAVHARRGARRAGRGDERRA